MDIQETYLMLLRKAIGLEASSVGFPRWETVEEIEAIVELAQRQGTGPLVFNELLKIGDRQQATGYRRWLCR